MKTIYILLSLLLLAAACNRKGGAFSDLEETDDSTEAVDAAIEIESYTPTADPVVMIGSSSSTFAISVNSGAGDVMYNFLLDTSTVLQTSSSPFYTLPGSSLSAGVHTVKVVATNSVSSAEKIFNIRRNQPAAALSSSPGFSGSIVNCDEGTLTFNALTADADLDSYTQTWLLDGVVVTPSTPGVVVTNTASTAQAEYTPSCSVAGFHTLALRLNDGYETNDLTWTISVANPAVETIFSFFPTSNNVTYLSTKVSDLFNATGSGVGVLTFTWKLDGVTVSTTTTGVTSNYVLPASIMSVGTHTLTVTLTDSSLTNDPPLPAERSWTIYKNQKPRILSIVPDDDLTINLNSPRALTASIEDALDSFTTTITKGGLDCVPESECGLSGVNLPIATGSFSATFTSGTGFLGENTFTLRVEDSYGEFETHEYVVTSNYFSDACNSLEAGEICTLVGLPGLGSGTNVLTNGNRVRVSPSRIIQDDLGNFFFSDHSTNTVWYYNVSGSSVTILNVVVPANSLYVVAGTGVSGTGANGQLARRVPLNFASLGGGLAWDSVRDELFVADYGNNRVLRIDSAGRAHIVCGGGILATQAAIAKNSLCQNPADLAFDTTNRRLYVTQNANHVIKVIDASNADFNLWPSYILAGLTNTLGYTTSTSNVTSFSPYATIAGGTRLRNPFGLFLDETDQILYFTENGTCRIRAIGLPGATPRTVGGQNITAANAASITQPALAAGAACGSHPVNTSTPLTANLFNIPTDLVVHRTALGVQGIYVTDSNHRVAYLNNSGAAVQIGNQTIGNQQVNNVFGNGTVNTPTNPPTGRSSALNTPYGLVKNGNTLYVAVRGGSIIRTLDVSVPNGGITNFLGGTGRAGYSGNAALDSSLVTTNNPFSLLYKELGGVDTNPIPGNMLFLNDLFNYMIRAINLETGRVEDFIGTGNQGVESFPNTVSTSTRIQGARSMAMYKGHFLYNDNNPGCFTRAYNPFPDDEAVFMTLVNQNKTSPVVGTQSVCGNFVGTAERDTTDLSAMLNNPWGIGADEAANAVYVSSHTANCILKVLDNGKIRPFIGTCGAPAGSVVSGGPYNDSSMLLNVPGEIVMDPLYEGNFFFTDWSTTANAHVKYVNLVSAADVEFFGSAITVAQGSIETVLAASSSPGHIRTIAAFGDWICYGSGSSLGGNNTIFCRNRVDGGSETFGVAGIGGIQLETEHEGASVTSGASTVTFALPSGLAFDAEGNLYVSEQGAHVVRKIKRWF